MLSRAARAAAKPALPSLAARALSSTAEPLVLVEKKDAYAVVRMNRPPVNSLSTKLIQELDATIKKLEDDKSVRYGDRCNTSVYRYQV
jgi:hypothetical protein